MNNLRSLFDNPPQSNNGAGVATVSAYAAPGYQAEALQENFAQGVQSAETQSMRPGQREMRNFKAGHRPAQLPYDSSGLGVYDMERLHDVLPSPEQPAAVTTKPRM